MWKPLPQINKLKTEKEIEAVRLDRTLSKEDVQIANNMESVQLFKQKSNMK